MNSEAGASEGSCQFLTAAGTGNTNLYTRDRLLSLISLCQLSLSPLHISSCIYFNERKVATRCPKTIHRMVAATIEVRAAGKDPASDEVAIGAGTAHAALGKANVTQWKLKTSSLLESLNGNQSTDMETGTSLRNKTHAVKGTNQLSFTTINNLCTNPGNTTMTSSGPMRKSLCTIGAHRPLSKSQGTDIKVATILLSKCQGTDIEAARILLNTTQGTEIEVTSPLPLLLGNYTDAINEASLLLGRAQIPNMGNLLTMAPAHTRPQCVFRKRRTGHQSRHQSKNKAGPTPKYPSLVRSDVILLTLSIGLVLMGN